MSECPKCGAELAPGYYGVYVCGSSGILDSFHESAACVRNQLDTMQKKNEQLQEWIASVPVECPYCDHDCLSASMLEARGKLLKEN